MKLLFTLVMSCFTGYHVQKATYTKTLVFDPRWGNIIRHTIGVVCSFPFILLTFLLFKGEKDIKRITLSYFLAYPAFGCGIVFSNITDHPKWRKKK